MAAGFWLVIVVLLGARVAMFDAIVGARVASLVSAQVASLAAGLH